VKKNKSLKTQVQTETNEQMISKEKESGKIWQLNVEKGI
jgi:hypothetical protein